MEGFYRKKGKARKPSAKYIWGRHLFFMRGEGLQGFYHADIYVPTPKFQTS